MYELKTFPNSDSRTPAFYVQNVGFNAGNPMNTPSANCWAVYTDETTLNGQYFYYVVLNAFNQGFFDAVKRGTAQPYITMADFYGMF